MIGKIQINNSRVRRERYAAPARALLHVIKQGPRGCPANHQHGPRGCPAASLTMGSTHYAALEQVREHLAPVIEKGRGPSDGVAVDDRVLKEAKDRVSKVNDPILTHPLPAPTQVGRS